MDDETEIYDGDKFIVLIIYDISNNKHRNKIAKYLSTFGHRVQNSCFEAKINKKQYDKLLRGIEKRLYKDDNIRIYRLKSYEEIKTYGVKDYDKEEDVIII